MSGLLGKKGSGDGLERSLGASCAPRWQGALGAGCGQKPHGAQVSSLGQKGQEERWAMGKGEGWRKDQVLRLGLREETGAPRAQPASRFQLSNGPGAGPSPARCSEVAPRGVSSDPVFPETAAEPLLSLRCWPARDPVTGALRARREGDSSEI